MLAASEGQNACHRFVQMPSCVQYLGFRYIFHPLDRGVEDAKQDLLEDSLAVGLQGIIQSLQ